MPPNPPFDHLVVSPVKNLSELLKEGEYQLRLYQAIRDTAQDQYNFHHNCIGAIGKSLLPVLYSVLGAFLYTFRCLSRLDENGRNSESTFVLNHNSHFLMARFVMAVIAGIAIGVFDFPQHILVSPLAISFVIGYSIDVFTSLLDGYVEKFTKASVETQQRQHRVRMA
jgi:hypothetical protein